MATPTNIPHYRTGKICYLEIPANDVAESVQFYQSVFGWSIRQHSDGMTAFDDTVGQVSGMWVPGRQPSRNLGLMVHIMVANVATTSEAIVAAGGEIVQSFADGEIYAYFRDPAGNMLGIYQQAGLAEQEALETPSS
ncbi:MAG TPA: VOC family protein [Ktedonobacterales bacterium]|nr:VOC family protein [Ktedonobacterales bacterium]